MNVFCIFKTPASFLFKKILFNKKDHFSTWDHFSSFIREVIIQKLKVQFWMIIYGIWYTSIPIGKSWEKSKSHRAIRSTVAERVFGKKIEQMHPFEHEHVKDPSLLWHLACSLQLWRALPFSSVSVHSSHSFWVILTWLCLK